MRSHHDGFAWPRALLSQTSVRALCEHLFFCVRECGFALLPRDVHAGLLGGELLEAARRSDADLLQMQAAAARYFDAGYKHNQAILVAAANCVRRAIIALVVEILALVIAVELPSPAKPSRWRWIG